MFNIVAFIGPSGCGKDYIIKKLCDDVRFNRVVSDTTRPPRMGEKDEIDYNFITVAEFAKDVLNGDMLDAVNFKDWYYGTNIKSLKEDKINLIAIDPERLKLLQENKEVSVLVYYIKTDDKQRLIHCLSRENYPDCKEVCRRFLADKDMFMNIENEVEIYRTFNNNYTGYDIVREVERSLQDDFIEF